MVYARIISGLGNQLFQYAVGRQLSLLRGTGLKLDLSFFDDQDLRSYRLDAYNIEAQPATGAEVAAWLGPYRRRSLPAKVFRQVVQLVPKHRRRYFEEREWWVHEPALFRAPANVYLDGYWQHHRYFEHLHPQVLAELTLRAPYPLAAQPLLREVQANPAAVSLHIRRGDYLTDATTRKLMGVLPLDYYARALAHVAAHVPNPTVYVFSDDLTWARDHLRWPGPLVPVDLAGGQHECLELDLMSRCAHHIIANSSFSWWGAFLNRRPGKIVVAPAQWLADERLNAKIQLLLPSWKRL